jgi:hypothetical protein
MKWEHKICNILGPVRFRRLQYVPSQSNASYATALANGYRNDDETAPKAFVTILLFDKDYNLVDAAWKQITTLGLQSSSTVKQPPHDYLFKEITVREPGYAYVFVSNEHPTYVDVYFDDVTVTHTPSPIVSSSDYFAFGLQHTAGERAGVYEQRTLFQSQELQDELNIGWVQFKWRNHEPSIGRFFNVDQLAEKYLYNSPYSFSENKVVAHVELEGLEAESIKRLQRETSAPSYSSTVQRSGQNIYVTTFNQSNDVYHTTQIILPSSATQSKVTDRSAVTIGEIATSSNESSVRVSSVARDSKDQARVMFTNLVGNGPGQGIVAQRELYSGKPGTQVIDTYIKGKVLQAIASQFGGTVTDNQIKAMMEAKINELGVSNVTRHASSDPNLNVIDIAPSSIGNTKGFIDAAKNHPNVVKFIPYPKDPGHHLEIKQN